MRYAWVRLGPEVLTALVEDRLDEAVRLTGAPLTPYIQEQGWLWRIRLDQLATRPEDADWIARAAWCQEGTDTGAVIGTAGFHESPDADGRVEVAYSVDPAHRRRGHARAMLAQVLDEVDTMPEVRIVRASISPDNAGSLATIRDFGFVHVGEQWDEEDGLEELWERPSTAPRDSGATMAPWGRQTQQDEVSGP